MCFSDIGNSNDTEGVKKFPNIVCAFLTEQNETIPTFLSSLFPNIVCAFLTPIEWGYLKLQLLIKVPFYGWFFKNFPTILNILTKGC